MSSDLHDLFKRDLNEIPAPEPDTSRPARRTSSSPIAIVPRWALATIVVIAVVVASLGIGGALTQIREQIAQRSTAAAGLPSFVAGNDLVYLAEDDLSKAFIQEIAMPDGTTIARLAGRGAVGSIIDRYPMRTGSDLALLPVWQDAGRAPGVADTYLQAVVLHSGAPTFRVDTGAVRTAGFTATTGTIAEDVNVAGPFVDEAAVSADGTSVFLVRDIGADSTSTQLTRYDAQYDPQTNTPAATVGHVLAQRTWPETPGHDPLWSRVIPLDGSRVALVRTHVQQANLGGRGTQLLQDWYFLDGDLHELASYVGPGFGKFAPTGMCSFDPIHLPNDEWALICGDPFGAAQSMVVHFLSGQDFHTIASVAVGRENGYPMGGSVSADGKLQLFTNKPLVLRYDINSHELIDARNVTPMSLLDQFTPSVALAKEGGAPVIQFTPDGRFAYVAAGSGWWDGLAVIDLEQAKLITHTNAIGSGVFALRFSSDGHRLYALSVDGSQQTTLALVDPSTLRVVRRSTVLPNSPSVVFAVATRR